MSVLAKLLGRGDVTYHIAIAEALDSVAAGIFAEQIAFWQDKSEDGWAFRSSDQIKEYTALTRRVQDTARKKLISSGVMEEKTDGAPPRLYFRLDLEALGRLIEKGEDAAPKRQPYAPKRQPDAPNAQTVCTKTPAHIEGGEREEKRFPERGAGAPTSSSEKKEKPNPMTILMDDLTDMGYSLSTNDRKPYAGQIAALRKAGVSEERIIKAVKRCASDWPDHPYSSLQKALSFAEKTYDAYKSADKKSEAISEKPEQVDDWKKGFYDKDPNFSLKEPEKVEGEVYFDRHGNPVTHDGKQIENMKEYLDQHGRI